jgi:hypothetical protein
VGRTAVGALLAVTLTAGATGSAGAETRTAHDAKAEQVSVYMMGDSQALTLGLSLATPQLQSRYDYTITILGILGCGVVDGPAVKTKGVIGIGPAACYGPNDPYTTASPVPSWQMRWDAALARVHPNVVAMLAGRWEDVDRVYDGKWTSISNPTFAAYVKQQLEVASNVVTSSGANMVFLTTPCLSEGRQPDGKLWPEDLPSRQAIYNRLVREVAAEHHKTDSVVNFAALVCPGGHFTTQLDGYRIRKVDGVHIALTAGPAIAPGLMPKIIASGRAQIARNKPKKKRIMG